MSENRTEEEIDRDLSRAQELRQIKNLKGICAKKLNAIEEREAKNDEF